jgi:hypothetical protein
MDDTSKQLRDTNLRFHGLCQKAREWLLTQLATRGFNSKADGHKITTTVEDEATGITADATICIWPKVRDFSKLAEGIKVRVERDRHAVNYARATEKWEDFPWEKIIEAHVEELKRRLKSRLQYRAEENERERLETLAKEEVPLPLNPDHFRGEYLSGYERRRNRDGTYHVQVNCHRLTAEQARIVRDFVLAANQITTHEKTTDTDPT